MGTQPADREVHREAGGGADEVSRRVTGQVGHQTGSPDRQTGGQPDGGTEEDQTDGVGWVDRQRFPGEQQAARRTAGVCTDGWLQRCSGVKCPLQRQGRPPVGTSSFSRYLGPGRMPGSRAFMGFFLPERSQRLLLTLRLPFPPLPLPPARVCRDWLPTWLTGRAGAHGSQDPMADLRLPVEDSRGPFLGQLRGTGSRDRAPACPLCVTLPGSAQRHREPGQSPSLPPMRDPSWVSSEAPGAGTEPQPAPYACPPPPSSCSLQHLQIQRTLGLRGTQARGERDPGEVTRGYLSSSPSSVKAEEGGLG